MGSVKDLITDDSPAGRLYVPPTARNFGQGAWKVSGRFSVGDLKKLIPDTEIENKAAALTMTAAAFFEHLNGVHPDIPTCYLGVMDINEKVVDTATLLDRGEISDIIVMRLAHVPSTYCNGNLREYREALESGRLECGVADVESIFRHGFPLGSSTFEKIFKAVYGDAEGQKRYDALATYEETVRALDGIRDLVHQQGLSKFSELERLLQKSHLGTRIPNPGFVLKDCVFSTTTKFEEAGDRTILDEEAARLSGLDFDGYMDWRDDIFPKLSWAQIKYCKDRGILNIDGKAECVALRRKPVVTDFLCTVDENREMIVVYADPTLNEEAAGGFDPARLNPKGARWAIPSNKEIQRAIFRQAGVYAAISEAKIRARKAGDESKWKEVMPQVLGERGIDLRGVSEHSCNLMAYAVSEIANRTLGKRIFNSAPLESWVPKFLPYASKIEHQEAA